MQDNTEVAIGNIMDTDYATEASKYHQKQQVLMQTGITMLKQSNSMSSMVSSLPEATATCRMRRKRLIRPTPPPAGGVVLSAAGFLTGNAISACFLIY